jgi:hypothetical protein
MRRDGLTLAQQIGIQNFTIQTDCGQVVETMKNGGFSCGVVLAICPLNIVIGKLIR